jgi:biopolymer transport protein ExbB
MTQHIDTLLQYVRAGGPVMVPLVAATFLLWYVLGLRAATLRRGSRFALRQLVDRSSRGIMGPPRGLMDRAVMAAVDVARRHRTLDRANLRRALDDVLGSHEREMRRGRVVVQSIVASAPLAGLLGTVTGMIETFNSLADAALFTQSGGIAGGISQALLTTQMGLSVAVPGLIVGRVLDRRQHNLSRELEQLKDLLCDQSHALREPSP